ncbi:acyltransferase [Candidatus Woesearchaeota archaeon]|nr:acyltransferase [Candidatus Woesearchaeota archaeon]
MPIDYQRYYSPTNERPGVTGLAWIPIIFSVVVFLYDLTSSFNGFRFDLFFFKDFFLRWVLTLLANGIFWISLIGYMFLKSRRVGLREDLPAMAVLVLVVYTILFHGGLSSGGAVHLAMAFLFYWFVLRDSNEIGPSKAKVIIALLILVDFFAYGIIKYYAVPAYPILNFFSVNRIFFPLWILASLLMAVRNKIPGYMYATIALLGIFFMYMFYFANSVIVPLYSANLNDFMTSEEKTQALQSAKTAFQNFRSWAKQIVVDVRKGFTTQLEYATGGYYQGKVEEQQDPRNKIGVYLENVQSADTHFFENEEASVWGDLTARALDFGDVENPINVKIYCDIINAQGEAVEKGTIMPKELETGYSILLQEQKPFECKFTRWQLAPGTYNVKIGAQFSFETYGFLKTYFMDIKRARALRLQHIDPLEQYGITERKPIAKYTNGPINLGIGTTEPPLGLYIEQEEGSDGTAISYVGVTVQRAWEGMVKSIDGLRIQLPKVIKLDDEGTGAVAGTDKSYCRGDFHMIGENDKKFTDTDKKTDLEKKKLGKEKANIIAAAKEGYDTYELDKKVMTEENKKLAGAPFKSWRCTIKIPQADSGKVLGKNPVATHFYRANVDYTFEIAKQVPILIKSVPEEKKLLDKCNVLCTSSAGCICPEQGQDTKKACFTPKGRVIPGGTTCDRYKDCASKQRTFEEAKIDIENIVGYLRALVTFNENCLAGDPQSTLDKLEGTDRAQAEKDKWVEICKEKKPAELPKVLGTSQELMKKMYDCGYNIVKVVDGKGEYRSAKTGYGDVKTMQKNMIETADYIIKSWNERISRTENSVKLQNDVADENFIKGEKGEITRLFSAIP